MQKLFKLCAGREILQMPWQCIRIWSVCPADKANSNLETNYQACVCLHASPKYQSGQLPKCLFIWFYFLGAQTGLGQPGALYIPAVWHSQLKTCSVKSILVFLNATNIQQKNLMERHLSIQFFYSFQLKAKRVLQHGPGCLRFVWVWEGEILERP